MHCTCTHFDSLNMSLVVMQIICPKVNPKGQSNSLYFTQQAYLCLGVNRKHCHGSRYRPSRSASIASERCRYRPTVGLVLFARALRAASCSGDKLALFQDSGNSSSSSMAPTTGWSSSEYWVNAFGGGCCSRSRVM